MWKLLNYLILIATLLHGCQAQDPTTTAAPTNIFQNVSVNPSQIINFSIPGARLLGLLTLLTTLAQKFGGAGGFMSRCFGAAGKLKLIMPFLLYKLGVIVTTLGFLTLFTLKGLGIGIILLVLNAGGWLGKIAFAKGMHYGHGYEGGYGGGGGGWGGGHRGWHGKQHSPPVHIHVHKDRHDSGGGGYIFNHPSPAATYGSYESYSQPGGGSSGSIGHSGPEYDPMTPSSWSERISKGFNVNNMLSRDLESSGVNVAYPRRVSPALDQNPIR